jgi:hypothetical protein
MSRGSTNVLQRQFHILLGSILIFASGAVAAAGEEQAHALINNAMQSYGGKNAWAGKGTLVVNESQTRHEESGTVVHKIVHYMDTTGKGYRLELDNGKEKRVYGWDGSRFWATLNGKHGDEALQREAKRVIGDAFYRFSLPFILDDPDAEYEHTGRDTVNGAQTEVVKITYSKSPADRFFTEHGHPQQEHGNEHGGGGEHNAATQHGGGGDHHGGHQVYNYHIDKDYRIVKVYFSHHGDDEYETLLFKDHKSIDGIIREQSRTLLNHEGQTHYEAEFSNIAFRKDIDPTLYKVPH